MLVINLGQIYNIDIDISQINPFARKRTNIMQIIQLKHFQAVVKYGSMNLAAENLFVSQSAISQSIQKLEKEYGVQFFDRIPGGKLRINENGTKMLNYIQQILSLEQEMKLCFQEKNIKTITLHSGGGRLFGPLIGNYALSHPNIVFNTVVSTRANNIRALIDGKADIIIDCGYIDEPENMTHLDCTKYITNLDIIMNFCRRHHLQHYFFYTSKLYLCVPKDSVYADYNTITLKQLSGIPVIRSSLTCDFEMWLDAIEEYSNLKFNTIMTVDNDTCNNLIFHHNYNTLIMSSYVMNDKRFHNFCKLIPVTDSIAERDFFIYARKGNSHVTDFLKSALNHFDWRLLLLENPL